MLAFPNAAMRAARPAMNRRVVQFSRAYTFDSPPSMMGSGGGLAATWPRTKKNTGICVCPQGERMVIERFGKMVSGHGSCLEQQNSRLFTSF